MPRREVVLFGDHDVGQNLRYADTWVWDGTTWRQRFPVVIPFMHDGQVIGARFYSQGFVFDIGANPLGLTVSNAGAGGIGLR